MGTRKTKSSKMAHSRREAARQKRNYAANKLLVDEKKKALLAAGVKSYDIDTHHIDPKNGDRTVSKIMGRSPDRMKRELAKTEALTKQAHSARHAN